MIYLHLPLVEEEHHHIPEFGYWELLPVDGEGGMIGSVAHEMSELRRGNSDDSLLLEWGTAGASWEGSKGPHTLSQHGGCAEASLRGDTVLVVCQESVEGTRSDRRGSQRHVNVWLAPSRVLSLPPSVDDERGVGLPIHLGLR